MAASRGLRYDAIDYEGEAHVRLQEAVDKDLGPDRGTAVVTRVAAGRPGTVLVDASRDASLLVVGSHHHHEITARLIDSIGYHCVAHADCPVVVVKHGAR